MIRETHNEDVAFLVTASELRDIKTSRRRKRQTGHPVIQPIELGLGAAPVSSPTENSQGHPRRQGRAESEGEMKISRTQTPAEFEPTEF